MVEHQVRTVVVGMGNVLLKDEGIGVHVARYLQEKSLPFPCQVEIIDGATSPDVVLSLKKVQKLVIIDAVQAGGEPGNIYRFAPEDARVQAKAATTAHQVHLLDNLALMRQLGEGPRKTVIIGIEPKEIDWGLEPSTEIKNKIPQVVKVVLNELGPGDDRSEKGVDR